MGKKRIHELAKELSMSSAELVQRIGELNLLQGQKLGASNSIEDSVAEEIRRAVRNAASPMPQVVRRRKPVDLPAPEQPASPFREIRPPHEGAADVQPPAAPQDASVPGGGDGPAAGQGAPPAPGEALPASEAAEAPEALPQEPNPPSAAPPAPDRKPVHIKQRPFDKATIIGTSPIRPQAGKAARKAPADAVSREQKPDFLRLTPNAPAPPPQPQPPQAAQGEPETPEAGTQGSQAGQGPAVGITLVPPPARPADPDLGEPAAAAPEGASAPAEPAPEAAGPAPAAPAAASAASPAERQAEPGSPGEQDSLSGREETAPPRPARPPSQKITRELVQERAARAAEGQGAYDRATVVGIKHVWAPSGAPGAAPRPPRPGPGTGPARPPWKRPAAGPRPEVAPAPAPEAQDARKRDRKRRGAVGSGHAEGEDAAARNRRRGLVERTDLYSEGDWARNRSRKGKGSRKNPEYTKTTITTPKAIKRRIKVDEAITVAELARRLSLKAGDIIKKLMSMGVMASVNQSLDFETALLVAAEFGYEVEKSSFDEDGLLQLPGEDVSYEKSVRPPVVTIMGHVDHGKTSLLDYIRKSKVQEGEAGGITQHIGAYHVQVGERYITFLDTPGHEAFTSMRSRGAQVTDIVILIVAADDGVMPQTREAADHARAAKVPIIVAVNKIDKPGADTERIRREMADLGLVPESWGGDAVFCDISAKTGQGVNELLELILLQADMMHLSARSEGPARGRVIEARLDKGRGAVATVLVGEGTLRQGDAYVCGNHYGRLRALIDEHGMRIDEAGPSMPVEIQGISGVPLAGDEFIAMSDEKQARQVSQHRQTRQRENDLVKTSKLTLENLFDRVKAGAVKGLNLILKADVQGSLEAIQDAVARLSNAEIKITVLHGAVGSVAETDVMLAAASSALIICFGVKPSGGRVQELAEAEQVQVRYYDVIYKLLDDIKEAMAGLLDPIKSETVLGTAEVRVIFNINKVGQVAGSSVTSGKIVRGVKARVRRGKSVVYDGKVGTLKREKNDAREVLEGYECGIGLENWGGSEVGDVIECYQVEETAATVELVNQAVERAAEKARASADASKAGE